MTEKLAFQLRSEENLTGCVTVKIRYSDFKTETIQATIPYTSLDHVLRKKVQELFTKLFQKRVLIRLIGIRFSHLIQGNYQFDMFDDTAEQLQLYQAMDKLRKRFGIEAVQTAAGMEVKKRTFNPFIGGRK